jgi:hypothetical protein
VVVVVDAGARAPVTSFACEFDVVGVGAGTLEGSVTPGGGIENRRNP